MIDWSKPLRTMGGRAARLLGTLEADTRYPKVVAVKDDDGMDVCVQYSESGQYNVSSKDPCFRDLVNPVVIYLSVCPATHDVTTFTCVEGAAEHAGKGPARIAISVDENGTVQTLKVSKP